MNGVNNMGYHSIKDLVDLCKANKCELWQVIMRDNANEHMISEKQVFDNMKLMYAAMKKQTMIIIRILSLQVKWQVATENLCIYIINLVRIYVAIS